MSLSVFWNLLFFLFIWLSSVKNKGGSTFSPYAAAVEIDSSNVSSFMISRVTVIIGFPSPLINIFLLLFLWIADKECLVSSPRA